MFRAMRERRERKIASIGEAAYDLIRKKTAPHARNYRGDDLCRELGVSPWILINAIHPYVERGVVDVYCIGGHHEIARRHISYVLFCAAPQPPA